MINNTVHRGTSEARWQSKQPKSDNSPARLTTDFHTYGIWSVSGRIYLVAETRGEPYCSNLSCEDCSAHMPYISSHSESHAKWQVKATLPSSSSERDNAAKGSRHRGGSVPPRESSRCLTNPRFQPKKTRNLRRRGCTLWKGDACAWAQDTTPEQDADRQRLD